jgi:transcriptional regulator with XRE-family HTH domain
MPMTLREARSDKNMTQEQLAEIARVDQATISDIETGRNRNPSWETVMRISKALDVAPDELFPLSDGAVA